MSQFLKPESTSPAAAPDGREQFIVPRVNIVAVADGYRLEAEMPGVAKSGLDVTVENDQIVLTGRRAAHEARGTLLHGESRSASFRRVFEIDSSIDRGRISAHLEQGVLTLHLPKAGALQPRKVPVTD